MTITFLEVPVSQKNLYTFNESTNIQTFWMLAKKILKVSAKTTLGCFFLSGRISPPKRPLTKGLYILHLGNTKKEGGIRILSTESWLFNRGPYNGIVESPHSRDPYNGIIGILIMVV